MNNVFMIVSFVLLGTILCAISSGGWWYYVGYNYYTSGGGVLGFGNSNDFSGSMMSIFGVVFGCVGGVILSLVIAVSGIPRVPSFFVGSLINGLTPIILFLLFGLISMAEIVSFTESVWLSLLGQFVIGGIIGLLVSVLTNYGKTH